MKHLVCAFGLALAALLCTPAHAADPAPAPAPAWTTTGNAALVSDYLFRGISQTQHRPTWQVTLEVAHQSGAYFGTFGSGVSHAAYANGSGSEIDLYGGWRQSLSETSGIDLGLVTYWYPGAQYVGGDGARIRFHTQELKAAYNWSAFNVTGWVSPTRTWFGFAYDPMTGQRRNTAGSNYVELNWNPALADGLTLNLHAGTQHFKGISAYNFVDAKLGVTWAIERWALAAAVSHNTGDVYKNGTPIWVFFDADGTGRNVAGTRALLSASYSF
jgi:uncharacterized protein (TIGR02001 family)